ncbi:DeoR family transcriptional regulator [Lentzea sp. NBRC 105346]|uniref:helix-turn-helix transcriptional regulator n=1 Tax=Lentzea sp. NBRC 105346 TaxID=3032205 RepID=UPI0024A4D7CF|nr:YafY family protein [Lentzea sp. NBRC 105346]GLZ31024.1 DeoR family transcriptional regulator [Lentzea sp. NBRC 105346]
MANTSSRTLRLLSLLQTHRYWPGEELATRLGVSVRTLRRDVDRLRELGYPVEANRGVDGGYQLAAGAALPPLVVDDDEAVAIAVGMQAATQGAIPGIEESAIRALTKVVQVMPPRLRRQVDALRAVTVPSGFGQYAGPPPLEPEVLIVVAQACRDSERIEFGYTGHGAAATERHVEPHRLVPLGRRWYLVAYDLTRHDWRTFRMDRLTSPRRTGARFAPRKLPGEDAAAFVRAGLKERQAGYAVEVVVHATAEVVRARLERWATIEEIDAGSCLVRMNTDSLDWPAMALGSIGAEFEVRSPPELITMLAEWSARFGRAV